MTLPKKTFVDLAENFRGEVFKGIGAFGQIKVGEDILEDLVVNLKRRGERIRVRGLPLLRVEMEEA